MYDFLSLIKAGSYPEFTKETNLSREAKSPAQRDPWDLWTLMMLLDGEPWQGSSSVAGMLRPGA